MAGPLTPVTVLVAATDLDIPTWNGQIAANVNHLVVAGADLAAVGASNTLSVTNEFHYVTLPAGDDVDNITYTPGAAVKGQQLRLLFVNSQTIRHNQSGTGNIRTISGKSYTCKAGTTLTFQYDGSHWWLVDRELPGDELDYQQITASETIAISASIFALITGHAITLDGTQRVKLEAFTPNGPGVVGGGSISYYWERDNVRIGRAVSGATAWTEASLFDTPASGSHTYRLTADNSSATNATSFGPSAGDAPAYIRVTLA